MTARNTALEKKLVDHIEKHVKERGYPPSLRDAAEHLDVSKSHVGKMLDRLVRDGVIRREPGQPRAITVMKARTIRV